MEKDILKIIKRNEWSDVAAKEITSHIMEFIQWTINFRFGDNTTRYSWNENLWTINFHDGLIDTLPIEEVYQYWSKNVKK